MEESMFRYVTSQDVWVVYLSRMAMFFVEHVLFLVCKPWAIGSLILISLRYLVVVVVVVAMTVHSHCFPQSVAAKTLASLLTVPCQAYVHLN